MIFNMAISLKRGEKFTLGGKQYEADIVGERIVYVYVLDDNGQRIKDNCSIGGYRTSAISDTRLAAENGEPKKRRRVVNYLEGAEEKPAEVMAPKRRQRPTATQLADDIYEAQTKKRRRRG